MLYQYSLYHLNIASDISFPDLEEVEFKTPDIIIKQNNLVAEKAELPNDGVLEVIYVENHEIGIKISDGKRIEYKSLTTLGLPIIRSYLLASGLGAILHQRGYPVLHGSAVEIDGEAVLFCGDSGMGKSNTAACFLKKGKKLLADDMCPIIFQNGKPMLATSHMNLKLTKRDIQAIGLSDRKSVDWGDSKEKHRLIADYENQPSTLPIRAIYMLEPASDETLDLQKINGSKCIYYLVKNTFRHVFVARTLKATEDLISYGQLSNAVHIKVLTRPLGSDTRDLIYQLVASDLNLD